MPVFSQFIGIFTDLLIVGGMKGVQKKPALQRARNKFIAVWTYNNSIFLRFFLTPLVAFRVSKIALAFSTIIS